MIASVASTTTSIARPAADAAKQRLEVTGKVKAATALANEQESAVVKISQQGAEQASQAAPPSSSEPGPADVLPEPASTNTKATGTTSSAITPKSNKPALAYEAADTDTDSKISAYEQQSYDFRHPELRTYAAVAKEGAAPPAATDITA